jgi:hypothetical protein
MRRTSRNMESSEEVKEINQLVSVPTGEMIAVQLKDKRVVAIEQAIVEILNRLDVVESKVL